MACSVQLSSLRTLANAIAVAATVTIASAGAGAGAGAEMVFGDRSSYNTPSPDKGFVLGSSRTFSNSSCRTRYHLRRRVGDDSSGLSSGDTTGVVSCRVDFDEQVNGGLLVGAKSASDSSVGWRVEGVSLSFRVSVNVCSCISTGSSSCAPVMLHHLVTVSVGGAHLVEADDSDTPRVPCYGNLII